MNETVTESASEMFGETHYFRYFSWFDYSIFTGMLLISSLIGIYFGCFGSKQSTASEYLMGGKKMKVFPIAMSLVASHVSGITLLAVPADVYRFGAGYWLCCFCFIINTLVTIFIYMPVFFNLGITSIYEYLHRRFNERTRMFASFLFTINQFLFLPIVIYIPALAFAAATGVNLHFITPLVCGICIFYTTIGGLKAVVWTDTLQFTITLGAVTAVLILGTKSAGGFGEVWKKALESHRLDIFDFRLDPTLRDNFWAVVLGYSSFWIASTNTNQGCVQKFLSVSTFSEAKWVAIYYGIGLGAVKSASVITGLIIYAKYSNCDPFASKQISRNDQLLPHYVLDVAGTIPGLSGLFIAGVFSAGLSTLSAHLNCLSGTIYEDFVHKFMHKNISEKTKSNILKLIVLICGTICTLLVFVFEHLGGILPLAIGFSGVTSGPLLGMFTLGVLFRTANAKGAFYGGISGLLALSGIAFPAQYLKSRGMIKYPQKPLSTVNCTFHFNSTLTSLKSNTTVLLNDSSNNGLSVFKISYYYYTLIGCLFTVIAGLVISYLTKSDKDKPVDENLISPLIKRHVTSEELVEYNTIEKAKHMVVNNIENKDVT